MRYRVHRHPEDIMLENEEELWHYFEECIDHLRSLTGEDFWIIIYAGIKGVALGDSATKTDINWIKVDVINEIQSI